MKRQDKAYVKESTVPGIGKGLFAIKDIKKDSIIAEFKGRLRKPGDVIKSTRSNIYFEDEYILECPDNDLASYANDAINFPKERRQLLKTLNKAEPLYKKHPTARVNAGIKINNNLHRVFLVADEDIAVNEEIFCHYGFKYWFAQEITKLGFMEEDEIEQNGFPEKIFDYPAFHAYIKEFYPKTTGIMAIPFRDFYDVVVQFEGGERVTMPMVNYAKMISKQYME